eukprot:g1123.t1
MLSSHIAQKASAHFVALQQGKASGREVDPMQCIEQRLSDIVRPEGNLVHLTSTVDNYYFAETLGLGGFCEVKLATHKYSNRKVAVKVMDKVKLEQHDDKEGVIEAMKRENEVLKDVSDHPHIVNLYEVIESELITYVIMDCARGGELFDYIVAHGHVEEHVACRFFHEIVGAVEYCHKKGWVHRDLKPENLLLTKDLSVILIDFGLAEKYDPKNVNGKARLDGLEHGGSPSYLAPEIIVDSDDANIGPKVDVWALGIVLYALVCGSLPFTGKIKRDGSEDLNDLFDKIVDARLRFPKFLSKEVKSLINYICQPHPDDRIDLRKVKKHKWYHSFYVGHDEKVEIRSDFEIVDYSTKEKIDQVSAAQPVGGKKENSSGSTTKEVDNASSDMQPQKPTSKESEQAKHSPRKRKMVENTKKAKEGVTRKAGPRASQIKNYTKPAEPGNFHEARPGAHHHAKAHARGKASKNKKRTPSISHAHVDDPVKALAMMKEVLKELPITTTQMGALQLQCQTHNKQIEFHMKVVRAHHADGDHFNLKLHHISGYEAETHQSTKNILPPMASLNEGEEEESVASTEVSQSTLVLDASEGGKGKSRSRGRSFNTPHVNHAVRVSTTMSNPNDPAKMKQSQSTPRAIRKSMNAGSAPTEKDKSEAS